MRRLVWGLLSVGVLLAVGFSMTSAQPPGRPGGGPGRGTDGPDGDGPPPPPPSPVFEALDKDHDGVLSAEEIQAAGESLKKLDKNGDGKLTEDELHPQGGPGAPPRRGRDGAGPRDRGPGGPDRPGREGPGRDGPGREGSGRDGSGREGPPGRRGLGGPNDDRRAGPDGPGRGGPGRGGPPSVLPPLARDDLKLTHEQQNQIDELDADVRTRLDKILSAEQKQQLEQMRPRGPGGPGGPHDGDRPEGRGPGRRPNGAGGRPGRPQRPVDGDSQ